MGDARPPHARLRQRVTACVNLHGGPSTKPVFSGCISAPLLYPLISSPPHMPRSCRARLSIHNARRRKRDPQGGGDGDMMGDAAPPPWMLTATKRVGPVITVDLEQHHTGGGGGGGQVSLRLM